MSLLRAAQALDSPDQVEARRLAACESARKYRERYAFLLLNKYEPQISACLGSGIGNF
jgi:hypothetical protein